MGAARYILGGFREMFRAFSDLGSAFYNFAEPMRLGSLTRVEMAEMIVTPLENLGVCFEQRNDVVNRIYDETVGQPNLLQFYGNMLVQKMDRDRKRVVSLATLDGAYEDESIRLFVLSSFLDNTTHLEKAVVFRDGSITG
jgi:hypothetical protein